MPIADTKKIQSLIQGILDGQVDVESGLVILLGTPSFVQKFQGWALIVRGIGKMSLIKAFYHTHNPNLSGSNLSGPQASSLNSYYSTLKQLLFDADVSGGYVTFRDGVNQAQIDHASIITTLKSKDIPSHGIKSLG